MIQRTASMSFKDEAGNKHTLAVRDIKENVDNAAIVNIMDAVIDKKLIRTKSGDLTEKQGAKIVVKDTTEFKF
ncbi:DUF2922 domain-containing protein [Clostridium sp.]|uniref:DUF2922 domain-containing protein n=1 Tax=Clostridium sp. TaxID=1506 RepID=UPI00290C2525|nr:DUF2922 domain-containing protein [Clostridium sp.]MDU5107852.1 DUF2922 domain-containing protein [Clostridium sp.]